MESNYSWVGTTGGTETGTIYAQKYCVNSQYALPNTDGTEGQIMCTDGAGNVTWVSEAGGIWESPGGSVICPIGSEIYVCAYSVEISDCFKLPVGNDMY